MYTLLIIGINLISFAGQYESEDLCKSAGNAVIQVELKKHVDMIKKIDVSKDYNPRERKQWYKQLLNGNIVYVVADEQYSITNAIEYKNITYLCNKDSVK